MRSRSRLRLTLSLVALGGWSVTLPGCAALNRTEAIPDDLARAVPVVDPVSDTAPEPVPRGADAARPGQAHRARDSDERGHHDHAPDVLSRAGFEDRRHARPAREVLLPPGSRAAGERHLSGQGHAAKAGPADDPRAPSALRSRGPQLQLSDRRRRRAVEASAYLRRRHPRVSPDARANARHRGAGAPGPDAHRGRRARELPSPAAEIG